MILSKTIEKAKETYQGFAIEGAVTSGKNHIRNECRSKFFFLY